MPQGNTEIVRAAYDAFNRRDWDGVFREADPDIEFTLEGPPDEPGPRRGRIAAQALMEEGLALWEAWSYELDDLRASAEQVVALLRVRARPQGTTAEIENRVGHVWTLRDGKVISIHAFPDRNQALEAAGLRE